MMKNRAALLALIVLAIATLLMIFVVLPRMSADKADLQSVAQKATDTMKEAAQTATEAAPQAVSQLKEKATATLEKMSRLSDSTSEAVGSLSALFDKGRIPSTEELAAAKQKAEATLGELSAIEIPEGIAGEALATASKLKEDATKALEWAKSMPSEPAAAAAAIAQLKTLFPKAFEKAADSASAAKPTETAAPAGAVLPTFDVLRVEPDGSTVIAGRAGPGVTVEIVNGDAVLSKAVAGAGGEFAAILDNPLPPGDHQLALRATGADGTVALSGEVATVSVPKDKTGQLLAMISTPGQASRLLTIPAPADAASAPDAAKAGTAPAPAPSASAASSNGAVIVNAVEIEGDKLFVAGQTRPGVKLRAFAGNTLIGEGTADASGNFVVDGAVPLSPGDHMIVVELLDASGNVIVKSSVPFNRPEGNQVAAVASGGVVAADLGETGGKVSALRENVTKAFILLKSLFEGGKVPGKEELAAARSATELALKALAELLPDSDASAAAKAQSAAASAAAAKALAALSALPSDASAVSKALASISASIDSVTKPAPAAPATAQQQAPLAPSDNAVIIRRGDTLWQISRRLYGQGVRYTTIYLANQKDIRNPDLIEPGQVFTVPHDALPNAEELHRKRLSGEPLQ
ncbi:MAG: LysM peptidoglycan-binding domain-containing protein [Proteobacteria bacterium]|nr:LysM peptidoglycan-binding domain-containing protein [Pseudomonadota bacterium]